MNTDTSNPDRVSVSPDESGKLRRLSPNSPGMDSDPNILQSSSPAMEAPAAPVSTITQSDIDDNSPPPYEETITLPTPIPRRKGRHQRPSILDLVASNQSQEAEVKCHKEPKSDLPAPSQTLEMPANNEQVNVRSRSIVSFNEPRQNVDNPTDDEDDDEEYEKTSRPPRKYLPMEVYATIVAAFSFLCIGLQRAYTSPAIASMKEDHTYHHGSYNVQAEMSNTVISWFAASPPLASFFGTILSGVSLQYLGRQKTLVLLTLPYILGWLLIAFASNMSMVMMGRAMTGLAAGISTAAAPMYVSECVRAKVRGFLGFVPAMMLSLGILLGFALSTINLEWQDLALMMTCFPVILFIFAIAVPESPTWLLHRGREKEAVESLEKLRGLEVKVKPKMKDPNEDEVEGQQVMNPRQLHLKQEIEKELEEMKRVLRKRHSIASLRKGSHPHKGSPSNGSIDPELGPGHRKKMSETFTEFVVTELLGKREIRLPAFIAASLMVFQQATGANAVIYYLSVILNEADPALPNATFINSFGDGKHDLVPLHKDGIDPNVASVIFGLVQFFAFFLSLPLIDRLGRRVLLMTSAVLMIFPHLVLGLYFWVKMYPNSAISVHVYVYKYSSIVAHTSGWLPLLCLCCFIAGYSIGWAPVPFIIMSEVFPSSARSYMVALSSLVNHLTLFFIVRVFPTFMDLLGAHIVFWTFAVFCFIALIHVAIFIPETKGKTLAEIELEFKKELNNDKSKRGKSDKEGDKCENCCSHSK